MALSSITPMGVVADPRSFEPAHSGGYDCSSMSTAHIDAHIHALDRSLKPLAKMMTSTISSNVPM